MTEITVLISPERTFSDANMILVAGMAVLSQFAYNLQHSLITYVLISLYELIRTFFTYQDKSQYARFNGFFSASLLFIYIFSR
jgi:hypothetical protein